MENLLKAAEIPSGHQETIQEEKAKESPTTVRLFLNLFQHLRWRFMDFGLRN
jgi:hypothetical protein